MGRFIDDRRMVPHEQREIDDKCGFWANFAAARWEDVRVFLSVADTDAPVALEITVVSAFAPRKHAALAMMWAAVRKHWILASRGARAFAERKPTLAPLGH